MLGEAYENMREHEWFLTRQLEFAVYRSSIGGMSGKPNFKTVKKPQDLYVLPSEKKPIRKKELIIPDKEHALRKIREAHKRK